MAPRKASLRASPAGLARLKHLGAYAARAASGAAPPEADGWARVVLPIESVNQAALALLGLAPEIEVLEPEALRERLRAHRIRLPPPRATGDARGDLGRGRTFDDEVNLH
jgi:predicted DNA-binding transcriptional regulator YafY